MKKLILYFISLITVILINGCEGQNSSNDQLSRKQEKIMQQANSQLGMPSIVNFQERKLAKQIYEARDQENLICYAYIVPEYSGKPYFIGKCLGYGLPYSTQYTNPVRTESKNSYGIEQLPQADPNGLFMPESADATWLFLFDSVGTPRPVYIESKILVSPFKLTL